MSLDNIRVIVSFFSLLLNSKPFPAFLLWLLFSKHPRRHASQHAVLSLLNSKPSVKRGEGPKIERKKESFFVNLKINLYPFFNSSNAKRKRKKNLTKRLLGCTMFSTLVRDTHGPALGLLIRMRGVGRDVRESLPPKSKYRDSTLLWIQGVWDPKGHLMSSPASSSKTFQFPSPRGLLS